MSKKGTTRHEEFANQMRLISGRLMRTEVNETGLEPYDEACNPIPPEMYGAAGDDDGFSDLTPDRYIDICIGDQITYYRGRTVELDRYWKRWQFAAYALIAVGTILAAIGADLWVPVTAAAVTAIITYIRTRQYDSTLTKYNQAETDLVNLRSWWDSLSPRAKRDPANIDRLVRLTEDVLQTETAGWTQRMQDALAELREAQQEQSIDTNQGGTKPPTDSSAAQTAAADKADDAASSPGPNGAVKAEESQDEVKSEKEA